MPRFESKITSGDVIKAALIVIGFIVSWAKLSSASDQNSRDIEELKAKSVRADVYLSDKRLNDERWEEVRRQLTDIRAAIARK